MGLDAQIGIGVHGTPIVYETIGSTSQSIDTNLNIIIGIDGRADLWILQNDNLGVAVFGEMSKGWLGKNTLSASRYGAKAFLGLRKLKIEAEISTQKRNTIRELKGTGNDFPSKQGQAYFNDLDRLQLGAILGDLSQFKISVFSEFFNELEHTAYGMNFQYGIPSTGFLFLSATINHPLFTPENGNLPVDIPTLPAFKVGYKMSVFSNRKRFKHLFGK